MLAQKVSRLRSKIVYLCLPKAKLNTEDEMKWSLFKDQVVSFLVLVLNPILDVV